MREASPSWLRVWDRPVRIIHWSLVLLMPALWWTWKSDQMPLHKSLGYVALGLIAFRLYWGIVGSPAARFASFVRGPGVVMRYVRGIGANNHAPIVGHNPLGAWSVIALLSLLVLQLASGLFTQDVDGVESGPLTYLISYDLADRVRGWHGELFYVLLALIALHIAAIGYHVVVKRDDLVSPMISGRRPRRDPVERDGHDPAAWKRAWPGILGAVLLSWWVSRGSPF